MPGATAAMAEKEAHKLFEACEVDYGEGVVGLDGMGLNGMNDVGRNGQVGAGRAATWGHFRLA